MKKKRVPKLRFPEFSNTNENNHFTTHRFEDIFQFSTGKNIKQSEASTEFEIPCVRYGELYHLYDEVIREIINKTNLDKDKLKFSHGDEILIPSAGEDPLDIGSASALTIKNIAIGRTINILRPNHEALYSQIFASYYINQRLRRKIATLAKGVSISNVYNSDLKKLKITLPSFSEQQKVADFLSSVDQKIQQLKQKKEVLEEYKKGVMQKLLSQEIRFKDENGEDFPDWESKKLKDIAEINPRGGELPESFIYIDLESVEDGRLLKEEVVTLSEAPSRAQRLLEPGDILFQTVRPYQMNNYLFDKEGNYVASSGYAQINANQNRDFLFHLLHYQPIVNPVIRWSTGSSFPAISASDLEDLPLPLPSEKEQRKIADVLNLLSKKIHTIESKIEKFQLFKKGLLQQMFV